MITVDSVGARCIDSRRKIFEHVCEARRCLNVEFAERHHPIANNHPWQTARHVGRDSEICQNPHEATVNRLCNR